MFNSLRGTPLLESFRKHYTIVMKYCIQSLMLSPIERKWLATDICMKRDCGRRHLFNYLTME